MNKKLLSLTILSLVIVILMFFFQTQAGTRMLSDISNEGTWILPLVGISALIDSINPCAFSVLFLTIAFLFSIGKMRDKVLTIGSAYILGIFIVYILIGIGILQTLQIFNTPNFMGKVGAVIMIALGTISLINEFFPKFPVKLKIPSLSHRRIATLMEKGTIPAAFFLGVFVGLCEFPCTGGPYLMVLGLLHDQTTFWQGLSYLLFYNVIFVSPLIVILLLSSDAALVEKVQTWRREKLGKSRLVGGIIMIIIGSIIFLL